MKQEIWVEKFRPENLDDVVGQDPITNRLKSYVKTGNLPHLLFAGPPGVGKTASAVAISKELFGEDWSENFRELNASDERGIDVVRSKIKNFARSSSISGADYKIIFLDEADSLTSDAQSALRRTMEKFSDNCRFILSANYSSKIIEPIQSRCAVFRFSRISEDDIKKRILKISNEEDLKIVEDALEAIAYTADGDMRNAINTLQSAAALDRTITKEDIYRITSMVSPENIRKLINSAIGGDFIASRDILDTLINSKGLAGEDIIKQMHKETINMNIPNEDKIEIIESLGDVEYRILEGADERIQIESILAKISLN